MTAIKLQHIVPTMDKEVISVGSRLLLYTFISVVIAVLPSLSRRMIPDATSLPLLVCVNLVIVFAIGEAIHFLFLRDQPAARKGETKVIGERLYYQGISRPLRILRPVQVVDMGEGTTSRYRIELHDTTGRVIGVIPSDDGDHLNQLAQTINSGITEALTSTQTKSSVTPSRTPSST